METALFLILLAIAAILFFQLGAVSKSGEFKSHDISNAIRHSRRKKR